MKKMCSRCKKLKSKADFYKDKSRKDRLTYNCKACCSEHNKKHRQENPEQTREAERKWRLANPEKVREKSRKHLLANPEKYRAASLRWAMDNREKRRKSIRKADRKRRQNPKIRLSEAVSAGIAYSLSNGSGKNGSHWEELVGYTVQELMQHLEQRFQPGMSWANYGGWHIDHKIPISVFNFTKPEDIAFGRCWGLPNLQPLWAKENMSKHNKIDKHFQPCLAM